MKSTSLKGNNQDLQHITLQHFKIILSHFQEMSQHGMSAL